MSRDDIIDNDDLLRRNGKNERPREEELPRLAAGETKFPHREKLYRSYDSIHHDQFEQLSIAEMEGDLSDQQMAEIEEAIENNKSLQEIRTLIQKTKLTPPAITFGRKRALKKTGVTRGFIRAGVFAAAAASVAAVVISVLLTSTPSSTEIISQGTGAPGPESEVTTHKTPATPIIAAISDVISTAPPPVSLSAAELDWSLPEKEEVTQMEMPKPLTPEERATPVTFTISSLLPMEMVYISYRDTELDYYGIATLKDNILIAFREKVLGRESPAAGPVKGYELAEAGVAGLNQLLGWEMSVNIGTSVQGEINSLAFSSKLITLNRSYKIVEDNR